MSGRRARRPCSRVVLMVMLACAGGLTLAAGTARAQILLGSEGDPVPGHYHSPRHFSFELRFGPYRPDVDSEFVNDAGQQLRTPYQDFFGSGSKLMTQIELDYEVFHRFGTAAVGLGVGYFQVSGASVLADGTGQLSGDQSTLKVVPVSVSAIYRFDYFLEMRNFPVVPYAKLGLDWAYWQITDGNDEIAHDGQGGTGRGGTLGWHVAGGIELVLDMFDPTAAHDFDADLGVNHTALVFEVLHADISGLGESGRLHLGDTTWSLGLLLEF
jgi:hypothetical protein